MRAAMAQGFQDSIKFMKESGMSEKEAMHMMLHCSKVLVCFVVLKVFWCGA